MLKTYFYFEEMNPMVDVGGAVTNQVEHSCVTRMAKSSPDSGEEKLVWGNKVTKEFRNKVRAISSKLGIDPNYLMAIMAFETGETFNPAIWNGKTAVGLIQFANDGAKRVGKTKIELSEMTAMEQLDYVQKFFEYPLYKKNGKTKLMTLEDVYMEVLYPSAVGKDNNYVLFENNKGNVKLYNQNSGFDNDPHDNKITKIEASNLVRKKFVEGYKHMN